MKQREIIKAQYLSSIPLIDSTYRTYQIFFHLPSDRTLTVGKLGKFRFPSGHYVYTGSAKRNMRHRIARHISKEKKLRWHIDYLLSLKDVTIYRIELLRQPECEVNASTPGIIIAAGLGASDCTSNCISHLKLLRSRRPSVYK